MTRFRFNAILRTAPPATPGQFAFQPWIEGGLDRLRETLKTERPNILAFSGVPDVRVTDAIAAVSALNDASDDTTVRAFRTSIPTTSAVDPQALWDLEGAFPYDVEIGWTDPKASQSRTFDALLRRRDIKHTPFALSAATGGDSTIPQGLTTDPARRKRIEVLTFELDEILKRELPAELVPSRIVVTDQLPENATQ
jgi:hypothetical protein